MTDDIKSSFCEITGSIFFNILAQFLGCNDETIINEIFQMADQSLERAINFFFSRNSRQNAEIKHQNSDGAGPSTSQQARLRSRKRNQSVLDKDM